MLLWSLSLSMTFCLNLPQHTVFNLLNPWIRFHLLFKKYFSICIFAYRMMDQFRRTKRGMIFFGYNFVIPTIVDSDDSYENLRIFFSFFCVIFFSSFFILVCSLNTYELKTIFTMEPKVNSCGSEWSRINRKQIITQKINPGKS